MANKYSVLICLRNASLVSNDVGNLINDTDMDYFHTKTETILSRYLEELSNVDQAQISKATANPLEFFVEPYAALLASDLAECIQRLTTNYECTRDVSHEFQIEQLTYPFLMRNTQVLLKDIRVALRSISGLQDCQLTTSMAADFEALLACANKLHGMIKDSLANRVASQSLEASQQSISESKKVNRLTLVAWVFIPVSLIASVFGMNVRELDPGPTILLFFKIVGPVVVAALVLEWLLAADFVKRKTRVAWILNYYIWRDRKARMVWKYRERFGKWRLHGAYVPEVSEED